MRGEHSGVIWAHGSGEGPRVVEAGMSPQKFLSRGKTRLHATNFRSDIDRSSMTREHVTRGHVGEVCTGRYRYPEGLRLGWEAGGEGVGEVEAAGVEGGGGMTVRGFGGDHIGAEGLGGGLGGVAFGDHALHVTDDRVGGRLAVRMPERVCDGPERQREPRAVQQKRAVVSATLIGVRGQGVTREGAKLAA